MPITETAELNKRLTFFVEVPGKGPHNNPVKKRENKYSCFCTLKKKFIKDLATDIGTKFEDTTTFVIRENQKEVPENDWKIAFKNKGIEQFYDIVTINPDVDDECFMVIIAKKVK